MARLTPRVRSRLLLIAAAIVTVAVTGIVAWKPFTSANSCPRSFDAAVIWTSEARADTEIQFYDDQSMVGRTRLRVAGAQIGKPSLVEGHLRFVANGDKLATHDDLVDLDLTSCTASKIEIEWSPFLQIVDDVVVGTVTTSGATHLVIRDLTTGDLLADVPDVDPSLTAWSGDRRFLYGFGSDDTDRARTRLRVIDRQTWREVRVVDVSSAGTAVADSLVVGHRLHFAPSADGADEDQPNQRLGVVDLADDRLSTIELPAPAPTTLASDGATVFVTHADVGDPAGMVSAGQISRIQIGAHRVSSMSLGAQVAQLSVSTDRSTLVGLHLGDDDHPYLSITELSGSTTTVVTLRPPLRSGFHYLTGVAAS